jgi:hypothetical protein
VKALQQYPACKAAVVSFRSTEAAYQVSGRNLWCGSAPLHLENNRKAGYDVCSCCGSVDLRLWGQCEGPWTRHSSCCLSSSPLQAYLLLPQMVLLHSRLTAMLLARLPEEQGG